MSYKESNKGHLPNLGITQRVDKVRDKSRKMRFDGFNTTYSTI